MHTGKPPASPTPTDTSRVYPRAYGETVIPAVRCDAGRGLPPCIRGNHRPMSCWNRSARSTPVHTGKPYGLSGFTDRDKVYPRAYGETGLAEVLPTTNTGLPRAYGETGFKAGSISRSAGLPPCIRGNHLRRRRYRPRSWSTPVHTGKPEIANCDMCISKVYPRAYGETSRTAPWSSPFRGLPPCIRGNRNSVDPFGTNMGSTPVHTGKPRAGWIVGCYSEVYPRAYGETRRNCSPSLCS